GDIASPDPVVIRPDQTLHEAMRLFGLKDLSMLPVVATEDATRLLGVLHRRDVLNAYRRALLEREAPEEESGRRLG
ncbi:MAG TPA: CBS domain-containing protein, partial [Candidatus Eisenbacteria bacterium]|nr:CBS domain-containing protein [Candidatus Eisenbacteria bacterium]